MEDPGLALLSPEAAADPYPVLHALRERSPVLWSEALQRWVLTGHDVCVTALRSPAVVVGREQYLAQVLTAVGPGRAFDYVSRRLTTYDPPEHTRLRRIVQGAFTAHRLAALRGWLAECAGELLQAASAEDGGRADLLARIAHPLPSAVICRLLGLPESDRPLFDAWTAALAPLIGPSPSTEQVAAGRRAAEEEWAHLERRLVERVPGRGDDVTSALLAARDAGELDHEELVATLVFLFSAGHQTTRDLLGNGLHTLLRCREQWSLVVAEPELVPAAVTEMLRHGTSVTATIRGTRAPVDLGGTAVPAGAGLVLSLAAANRDPARYSEPDRFELRRPGTRPLSFGGGPHHCLGAALARMEAEAVLTALVTGYPRTTTPAEHLEHRPGLAFRGPTSLPVVLA